jgi:CRISPR-associated protein Cmr6
MTAIANASQKVPMMFRSQVEGRCQLQRIDPRRRGTEKQDVQIWAEQWIDRAEEKPPQFRDYVQTRSHQLTWRFITNGGQDDGVIRPVIGARGVPFYPGSSMKGLFRRACTPEQRDRYCGDSTTLSPGILRFHGGYPTSNDWTKGLVDIVHPQKEWQVQEQDTRNKPGGAFAQISLYKPELRFGISSTIPLLENEWETIWQIWENAIATGIGCRVSAGYGQVQTQSANVLFRCRIKGQGLASKQLDGSIEFRPNIFRAALRGHALRIFGGLTDEATATGLVDTLFGGIQRNQAKWGLLSMQWCDRALNLNSDQGTYNVTGDLIWQLTQELAPEAQTALKELVKRLMQFAMLLGGFGKSWRRADHRLFLEDYDDHIIGCHWEYAGKVSPVIYNPVRKLDQVTSFLEKVETAARNWMQIQNVTPQANPQTDWRETWHPQNVQVWGRLAEGRDNSLAIQWLHREYSYDYKGGREVPLSIQGTSVTGMLNQISRLWHRMYPVVLKKPDPESEGKFLPKPTPNYLELITIFPDDTPECDRFLQFLQSNQTDFQRL